MLNHGREGFFYSWSEKKPPALLFEMPMVVAAIIPEGNLHHRITGWRLNMNNLNILLSHACMNERTNG